MQLYWVNRPQRKDKYLTNQKKKRVLCTNETSFRTIRTSLRTYEYELCWVEWVAAGMMICVIWQKLAWTSSDIWYGVKVLQLDLKNENEFLGKHKHQIWEHSGENWWNLCFAGKPGLGREISRGMNGCAVESVTGQKIVWCSALQWSGGWALNRQHSYLYSINLWPPSGLSSAPSHSLADIHSSLTMIRYLLS